MPAHYTDQDLAAIANAVLAVHPVPVLQAHHAAFVWKGTGLPAAWNARAALVGPLQRSVTHGSAAARRSAVNDVQQWGFDKDIPKAAAGDPTFDTRLNAMLTAFLGTTTHDVDAREGALAGVLSLRDVGIAAASKWICFLDPSRYGIYDSRVSVALRQVVCSGHRALPIVGRRPVKGKQAFMADALVSHPLRMARAYLDYLAVLEQVAKQASLLPAQVEMALFMLGDVWANGQPPLQPLPRGMWS